jgi:PcfJ-like protein
MFADTNRLFIYPKLAHVRLYRGLRQAIANELNLRPCDLLKNDDIERALRQIAIDHHRPISKSDKICLIYHDKKQSVSYDPSSDLVSFALAYVQRRYIYVKLKNRRILKENNLKKFRIFKGMGFLNQGFDLKPYALAVANLLRPKIIKLENHEKYDYAIIDFEVCPYSTLGYGHEQFKPVNLLSMINRIKLVGKRKTINILNLKQGYRSGFLDNYPDIKCLALQHAITLQEFNALRLLLPTGDIEIGSEFGQRVNKIDIRILQMKNAQFVDIANDIYEELDIYKYKKAMLGLSTLKRVSPRLIDNTLDGRTELEINRIIRACVSYPALLHAHDLEDRNSRAQLCDGVSTYKTILNDIASGENPLKTVAKHLSVDNTSILKSALSSDLELYHTIQLCKDIWGKNPKHHVLKRNEVQSIASFKDKLREIYYTFFDNTEETRNELYHESLIPYISKAIRTASGRYSFNPRKDTSLFDAITQVWSDLSQITLQRLVPEYHIKSSYDRIAYLILQSILHDDAKKEDLRKLSKNWHSNTLRDQTESANAMAVRFGIEHASNSGHFASISSEPTTINNVTFEPILTHKRLLQETSQMHNCVASFSDTVQTGSISVFHLTDQNGSQSTLGVALENKRGKVKATIFQNYGISNRRPSLFIDEAARQFIKMLNQDKNASHNASLYQNSQAMLKASSHKYQLSEEDTLEGYSQYLSAKYEIARKYLRSNFRKMTFDDYANYIAQNANLKPRDNITDKEIRLNLHACAEDAVPF